MKYARVFKSGNTHRLTLPRAVFQGLHLQVGDTVSLNHVRDGLVEMRNLTYDTAQEKKRRKKAWR